MIESKVDTRTIDGDSPFLGTATGGLTILFTKILSGTYGKGTVLAQGDSIYSVGTYLESWSMNRFTPLPVGTTVTLIQK